MKKIIIAICLLAFLFLAGCSKTETSATNLPVSSDATLTDQDMADIDSISQDLDTSGLDDVEAELDNLNW